MTPDEVLAVLASGEFESLVGVPEDASLDFKGAPYRLDSDSGKHELAKDVAAFASGQGPSAIVFPVETERTADSPFELAARVRPIARSKVDEKQICLGVAGFELDVGHGVAGGGFVGEGGVAEVVEVQKWVGARRG